jgi:hypothetical protein
MIETTLQEKTLANFRAHLLVLALEKISTRFAKADLAWL